MTICLANKLKYIANETKYGAIDDLGNENTVSL